MPRSKWMVPGGLALALTMLAACGGDGGSNGGGDCDPIAATLVARVAVTPTLPTVTAGESVQFTATAYSCAETPLTVPGFTWTSEDASTVSVSGSGVAVGVKVGGPVTVTAAVQGKQGSAHVLVAPRAVASVQVTPAPATVAVGRTSTLVAHAYDAQGTELPGRAATWSSADGSIVTVSAAGAITGVAVGGPVAVTATIEGQSGTAAVTVVAAAVATVTVSPATATIAAGSTVQLSAELKDDQGTILTGRAVLWSTSDAVRASVSSTGLVTGRAAGGPVAILATSEGRSGSSQVTVNPPPLVITTTTLPPGAVGTAYSQAITATGGTTPYTWTIASGTLPAGLTLGSAGIIGGTPTTPGRASFTVQVGDGSQVATRALTLDVVAALAITTTTLPAGTIGVAYNQTISATGGATPYTWTVVSGTLPTGLSLSGAGLLSGTPTIPGSSDITVQVTDGAASTATKPLTLAVSAAVSITTTSVPPGTIGAAYNQTISATGGATPYTWTVASGTLPAGLTLSSAGVLNGTPTTAGNTNFTVRVTDADARTTTQALALVVSATVGVTTTSLLPGTTGAPYSATLAAAGGAAPYAWAVSAGALPAGLTLSGAGVLSGTPTVSGSSSFTVQVTDAAARTGTRALTLVVSSPVSVVTATLPPGTLGAAYSQEILATGGAAPYTWTIASGTLPAGLALSSAGILSGTPTSAGSVNFSVRVTDGAARTATQALTLDVAAALRITTTTVPAGTTAVYYSQEIEATGGATPYDWIVAAGTLPAGLVLSSAGILSGTPLGAGSSSFTVQVSDASARSATQVLVLEVLLPLGITTTVAPEATVGTAYTEAFEATGGRAPYTWTIVSGAPPEGLTMSGAGVLSGTPTVEGSSSFTVQVMDSQGLTATQALTVVVNPGAPAQISWVRQPSNTTRGEPISPAPSVLVRDGAGNPVAKSVTVTMVISSPSSRAFAPSSTVTASTVGGIATFSNLRIDTGDNRRYRIRAIAGSIQSVDSSDFRVR